VVILQLSENSNTQEYMEDETLETDIFTLMVFLKMLFASLLDSINSCHVCKI